MGYTHYWMQTRDFTPEQMGDIAAAVRRIIKTAQKREVSCGYGEDTVVPTICSHDGTGSPELTEEHISFNGQGPDFDHETFYIPAKRELPYDGAPLGRLGWAFCKTARKPYDIVVTACLTFLQADYGFEVGSDGSMEEWEPGVALAEEALGRAFANPIIVEEMVR